jgi:hypothetical protein
MACQVSSSMVSTRLAASEYSPGMPTSAVGGAVGPGLLWPLSWALSFSWAGQVFVGFGDALESAV